jgi:hypothetical protein
MPRPLHLDLHGAKVFADWKRTASGEDVELVGEVLKDVSDGSWIRRWHSQEDVGDPKVTVISPREDLLVSVVFETGEADVFDVEYIGPHPDNWP